jgi:hypothetical protein
MSAELARRLVLARAILGQIEEEVERLHHPQAIEHAVIAGLAMRHLAECVPELNDPAAFADAIEREWYGELGDAA